jgi:TfoX/Sxy family transcriptional regulator of competence genes
MRRGAYPMDLTRQLKVRIDESTFQKITRLSEEEERTKAKRGTFFTPIKYRVRPVCQKTACYKKLTRNSINPSL